MKLFKCQACGQVLYFENTHCERCSRQLGYCGENGDVVGARARERVVAHLCDATTTSPFLRQAAHNVCNWLMDEDSVGTLCAACCTTVPFPTSPSVTT